MWENVRFSMNSTMPLFFVMLLGYVLYQKKFLSDAFVAGANKFVFYVALPVQLFRDLAATDVRAAFDGAYVLFCFVVTLVSILGIWALAKLFLPDKRLVGEFVQVCYRSSAAILGTAFLQSIYGTAEMSSMMILGSVPLYNVMAVVILMLEGPEAAQAGSMTAKLKKSVKGILTNPTLLGIARRVCLEPAGPAHAHHGRQDPLQHCQPDKPAGAAGHRGRVQGPQGAGLPAPHGCGNCRQVDGPAGAVPAGGGASGLYGRKTGGPAGDAGQHCHAKLLCYGKADGPRGRAYRQCVRHHHPVQRIQPDFLAVFAAEHGCIA